jgi:hypothetical protein
VRHEALAVAIYDGLGLDLGMLQVPVRRWGQGRQHIGRGHSSPAQGMNSSSLFRPRLLSVGRGHSSRVASEYGWSQRWQALRLGLFHRLAVSAWAR